MSNPDLSKNLRIASKLPKGHPRRLQIIASVLGQVKFSGGETTKTAVSTDTEDFIEWVLATQGPMNPNSVQRFLEAKSGREPKASEDKKPAKKGPLAIGETVMIDKFKNINPINVDACEQYHNRVGTVDSNTSEGMVIAFYKGDTNRPSTELSGEKQFFEGLTSGKDTGVYRWTSRSDYMTGATSMLRFEAVYLRADQKPPDQRRTEVIEKYIEMGEQKGENRSRVYYSGVLVGFAYNKKGTMHFSLATSQRDYPGSMNPTEGKLLYIGVLGKRPAGWKQDAIERGLAVK